MVDYYKLRRHAANELHNWFIAAQKEIDAGRTADFRTFARRMSIQHGIPLSMFRKMLQDSYGCTVDENGELVKQ